MMYRDFKNFEQEIFRQGLCSSLSSETAHKYTCFEENFLGLLNKHTPLKKKVLCSNHAPQVTKALSKAIMKRSYLEKLFIRKRTLKKYNKHKDFVVDYIRGNAKNILIHQILTKSHITQLSGKTSELFFEKGKFTNKITLEYSEDIIIM